MIFGGKEGVLGVIFLEVKINDDIISLGKLDLKVVLVVMEFIFKVLEEMLVKIIDNVFFDLKFVIFGVKLMFVFNKIKD